MEETTPNGMAQNLIKYANENGIYWIADAAVMLQKQAERIKELEADAYAKAIKEWNTRA